MLFDYTVKKDQISVISLEGDLMDKGQATKLLSEIEELIATDANTFVIDLKELKHLNSSGLNVLISILTKSRKAGGDVAVANLSPKVKELFLITKLNSVFNVSDSVQTAKEQLTK